MIREARGNRPEGGSGCDNLAVDVMFAGGAPASVNGPNEDG
jgi:hypothetical protein